MLPNSDNSQPGADSTWPPTMFHPQPGGDLDCLAAAAQLLIDAQIRLETARNAVRRANKDVDLKEDHFMQQLQESGLDAFEHLVFTTREGQLWAIHVDIEDGSVRSVFPALEVK